MTQVTWNAADVAGNWVLSGGNLIATDTVAAWASGRANVSHNSGKLYFEITISGQINFYYIGIATTGGTLAGNTLGLLGATASCGYNISQGGDQQEGAITLVHSNSAAEVSANAVYGVAVDFTNQGIWMAKGNDYTLISASGTSNPATNVNPIWTFTGTPSFFPAASIFGQTSPSSAVTIAGNAGALTFSPPSGFSAWEPAVSVASFRRTLSPIGTRVGSRQQHQTQG